VIWPETLSEVGLPAAFRAGLNLARCCKMRQVVASNKADPLDAMTVHVVTRPLAAISSLYPMVPDAPGE
jgi:hypothetical protein